VPGAKGLSNESEKELEERVSTGGGAGASEEDELESLRSPKSPGRVKIRSLRLAILIMYDEEGNLEHDMGRGYPLFPSP